MTLTRLALNYVTCAIFRVEVETYYVVTRFQSVSELHVRR